MAWILAICILILVIVAYKTSKKEIIAPSVVFSFPFLLMSIVGIIKSNDWELNAMSEITLLSLVMGISFFVMGSYFQSRIKISGAKHNIFDEPDINNNITNYHLLLSLFVEISAFLLYVFFLLRWGSRNGAIGLANAINTAMMNGKFALGSTFNLPFFVLSLVFCSKAMGYICGTILAKNIIYNRKGHTVLLLLNTMVPIGTSLLNGSRGSALEPIVGFFVAYVFYNYKQHGWRYRFKLGQILKAVFLGICLLYLFFAAKGLMGRTEMDWANVYDDLFRYLGAQEKNLDMFFNSTVQHSSVIGYSTLRSFYNTINTYLGLHIYDTIDNLSFVVFKGTNLGNVYTCFYDYFIDGGLFGVAFFSFLSGWISQYVYRKAKNQSSALIDYYLVVYCYITAALVFSFFGNRFYNNLLGISFVRLLIWMYMIKLYFTKVRFRKG